MNWNIILGTVTSFALLLPVFLIFLFKLYRRVPLLFLAFYYLLTAVYNLAQQGYIPLGKELQQGAGWLVNYLDAPLMLAVLLFFCNERWKKKVIYYTLCIFAGYEAVITISHGFSNESVTKVLGPGILIILGYSMYLFGRYGKLTVIYGKNLGLTLMLVSILFSYGCFSIVYFLHYIEKTPARADVYFIYYIVVLVSALCMAGGIFCVRRRIRQIKEVQLTRRELTLLFHT